MNEELQRDVLEFQRGRQQLMSVSGQRQQLQLQSSTLGAAMDEMDKSKEETVYKAVGNILIKKKTSEAKSEIKESKETLDLRIKTLSKQEESLLNKLNKLRAKIEKEAGPIPDDMEGTTVTGETGKKSKKKKK